MHRIDQAPVGPTQNRAADAALARSGAAEAPSVALEAIARALLGLLIRTEPGPDQPERHANDTPLLDVDETAELLGVSRMTVTRLIDEGQIPSVTVRKGKAQKLRRIPRAFVERLVADANAGAQVDMEAYAAAWLTERGSDEARRG